MLFGSFMATGSEDQPLYAQVEDYDVLRKALDAKLAEYNESNASMDLVLFQQVRKPSQPVCRAWSSQA